VVTPSGILQLQVVTVVKVTVVKPPAETVAGLQLASGVPVTPVAAGLELEPFNARNKTVYVVPFVKPEIVKEEVVPPVVVQLVPLFIEYSYPVIVAPLLVGAVNATLKLVGPDVTEVIAGAFGGIW
jgi:hypothetical protein